MKKIIAAIFLGGLFFSWNSRAADLKESKFTQVVNDVQVIASDKSIKPAAINGLFDMPDVLRTGADSRAELVADDRTITRVGANTIFSFDQASRTVNLQQGSLLFHSDKGKGGGTIRTGAATASVLGTTLIVVSTPNGGFKVLLLEGKGEVHFLNGIRQHLAAGQMTFVLPGGSPGPVLYFRLSDQVSHSLLVQGFAQPLTSLPLINNVINIQNKLISSGKAVDTGLLVAGEPNPANPSTVPVVYIPNTPTVSAPPSPTDSGLTSPTGSSSSSLSGPQLALTQDLGINSSTLNPNNVFIQQPGFNVNDPNAFLSAHNPAFGFPGNNISVSTATIDLSPYANQSSLNYPEFRFVALNNLNIQNSVTFTGLLPGDNLVLSSGNQLTIAPGSTVEADVSDFELASYAAMTLDNVGVVNNSGNIGLNSASDINVQNGATISALTVNVKAGGDITLNNANVISGNSIVPPAGSHLTLSAGGVATGNNIDLSSFVKAAISAHTVVLLNVQFALGSVVDIQTDRGGLAPNPNTGASVVPGILNMVNGVTYGGLPAQNFMTTTAGAPGIYSHPL